MSSANLDHQDLSAALAGGLVRESVMEKIWEIDQFPLPFFNMCAKDRAGNRYHEWTIDELGAPVAPKTGNKQVDGADMSDNDESIGTREGAHCQIMTKQVNVSHRANDVSSIGRQGSLSYQLMQAQKRLRRDVEAQFLSDTASVQDDGVSTAGVTAGYFSWLQTSTSHGATGQANGFNTTTKVTDAPTFGTARALDETSIRDIAQSIYEEGGETRFIMGTPTVIRALSAYLFTSSARIATMTSEEQGNQAGQSSKAYGSVSVFVTDFGQVLTMIANRLHPLRDGGTDTAISNLAFIDPRGIRCATIQGFETRPLARTGLSEKRLVSWDGCLCVTNEKMQGGFFDIDETAAVIDVQP